MLALGFVQSAMAAAPPPANDHFTNAIVLTGTNVSSNGSNVSATREPGEPFHTGSIGTLSAWWTWTAPFTGSVGVSTEGSGFDSWVAVYTGDTVSNLARVSVNDDIDSLNNIFTSRVVFRAHEGETFRIAVDGEAGAQGSIRLSIAPAGTPFPDWTATNIYGGVLRPVDFTNEVLLIDFWETTCQGCVDEMPGLALIHRFYHPQAFSILGLTKFANDPTDIRSFIEMLGVTYPVGLSSDALELKLAGPGGLPAVPTKYLLDREGKIVFRFVGASANSEDYEDFIRPLIRGSTKVRAEIRNEAGVLKISWPATEFGYGVEATENVLSENWTRLPGDAQLENNRNTVTLPVSDRARFFRLKKP